MTDYIRTQEIHSQYHVGDAGLVSGIGTEMGMYKELRAVPQDKVRNFRNDMYMVSEALRLMQKSGKPQVRRGGCGRTEKLQDAHR